jgi:hypothetical protein
VLFTNYTMPHGLKFPVKFKFDMVLFILLDNSGVELENNTHENCTYALSVTVIYVI